jgi:hypothetical protein
MATSTVTTVEMVHLDEPLDATERGAIAGYGALTNEFGLAAICTEVGLVTGE